MTAEPITAVGTNVEWRRVGVFTAIAAAGPLLVAGLLLGLGSSMQDPVFALPLGSLAMLFPLFAGLVIERMGGRKLLLTREVETLRGRPWRRILTVIAWSAAAFATIVLGQLLVAWLGSAVPGAGRYGTPAEIGQILSELSGTQGVEISAATIITISAVQAFVAGLTINGIVAFGEEYGWRGVLAEELLPLGVARANVLTGIIWGLWHAPLIALGHNYQDSWAIGILMFVLITIPLSFILWWARARAGSVAASAAVHGAFNGFAGVFALVLVGADVLVAVPVGLMGSLALTLVALVLWRVPRLAPPKTTTT